MRAFEIISHLISILGMVVIIWGVVLALAAFAGNEARRLRGGEFQSQLDVLRSNLGGYLLLGLEFLVAGDIIATIIEPSYEQVIILGAIVLIRTTISYFVGKERELILKMAASREGAA